MRNELMALLKTEFNVPVKLQGSLAPTEAYPARFFTIWNDETTDGHHYDNAPIAIEWDFSVFFYSEDPQDVIDTTEEAIQLLRTNGWIIDGRGYDVASDEPTHTGRGFDAIYSKREILGA